MKKHINGYVGQNTTKKVKPESFLNLNYRTVTIKINGVCNEIYWQDDARTNRLQNKSDRKMLFSSENSETNNKMFIMNLLNYHDKRGARNARRL